MVPATVTMPAPATAVTLALILARCSDATRCHTTCRLWVTVHCQLCCRGELDPDNWENSVYHHKYSHHNAELQLQQGDTGEDRVDLQPVVDFFLEFE